MRKRIAVIAALTLVLTLGITSLAFAGNGTWMEGEAGWWFQNSDGSYPANTWVQIDGDWYHFNAAGYMDTGWLIDGGTWYYCYPNGKMANGWEEVDGFWYYFQSGGMLTGWHYFDENWYYFRPDGVWMPGISYGDAGNDVWYMQLQLSRLGYLTAPTDGYYGTATYAAVCAFKAAHGDASPNGYVDGHVLDQMCSSYNYFSPVCESSSYSEIYAVQEALVACGRLSYADGVYGSQTRQAVEDIQFNYGLSLTGTCDMATLEVLYNIGNLGNPGNSVQWYSSYTNWLIYVNTTTNMLYVYYGGYGNWKLQYSWGVSTGAWETPTVLGQFTIDYKGYSFGEGYTCYYYSSFYGDYLLHSTLFWENTFIPMDPTIGKNISHGCVRMALENAKWIYDNIPYGTRVVVVN